MYKETKPKAVKGTKEIDKVAVETFARAVEADTPYQFIVKWNEAHPDNMVEIPDVESTLNNFERKVDRVKKQIFKGEVPEDAEIALVLKDEYSIVKPK